jgi:hypothetical protein
VPKCNIVRIIQDACEDEQRCNVDTSRNSDEIGSRDAKCRRHLSLAWHWEESLWSANTVARFVAVEREEIKCVLIRAQCRGFRVPRCNVVLSVQDMYTQKFKCRHLKGAE